MHGRRQHGEGSFFQRTRDGMWVARAHLGYRPDGQPDTREFTSRDPKAALDRRTEFLGLRRDGFTMPKGRQPYVSEWFHHWLYNVAKPRVRESTWERSYRQKTEDLIIPAFARVPLGDLDEAMIRAWHAYLLTDISDRTGQPRSPATISQAHRILSMGLREAVISKKIQRNPAANVPPPPPDDRDRPEPPGEDEILAVLRECEDRRTGPRWVTALGTGMRQGEALGLLVPCVHVGDPDNAWVDVQWELVRMKWRHGCADPAGCGGDRHVRACPQPCPKVRASGRRHACIRAGDPRCCAPACEAHASTCPQRHGGGLRLMRPKSAKSRRQVPLPPYAAAALRDWLKTRKEERLACPAWTGWGHDPEACAVRLRRGELVCPRCRLPARPDLVVFCRPDGRPADPHDDWEDWAQLLEAAGVEHTGTHGGRHAFATALLEEGEDIRVVQELMGHATPHFTQATYQHVSMKLKRSAAGRMNRRMGGGG